jgi:hypothetical protein
MELWVSLVLNLIHTLMADTKVNLGAHNSINSFSSSWAEIKFGLPQGSILGPLLFLLCINDITKVSINGAKNFIYTDDTSIIVTNSEYDDYKSAMNKIFYKVNTWFRTNLLELNVNKTHILQFITMYHDDHGMYNSISYKLPTNFECIKFLV